MKITKEDLANVETASPLELFEQGIRAKETKTKYTNTLRRILCEVLEEVLEGTFEQRATRLVREGKKNPIWVSSSIRVGGFEIKWEHIRPIYHSDKGLSFDKGSECVPHSPKAPMIFGFFGVNILSLLRNFALF